MVHSGPLVSKQFFKWNIQSLAKYLKINYIGFSGNNIAKFMHYQMLANKLISKLTWNENLYEVSCFFKLRVENL